MRRRQAAALLTATVLVVFLILGVTENAWTLVSLLQLAPWFILGGITSVLLWGFKDQIENIANAKPRLPITRIDHRRKFRVGISSLVVPIALTAEATWFVYEAATTWQTLAGYVCNGTQCGYLPVLTFANALSIVLVGFGLLLIWRAYLIFREIRESRQFR